MATNSDKKNDLLSEMMQYVKAWAAGVSELHLRMKRDYEFVNGKQAKSQTMQNISKTGRELLFFNEIRPQFELLSGYRASQEYEYIAAPRGREDRRLGTIVSHLQEATYEEVGLESVLRRVGDDGDIGGLGAIHAGHTFDFADDVVWGDIFVERISPFSFLWDVWGTPPQFQDGKFMGHRWWMEEDEYYKKYPQASKFPLSADFFSVLGQSYGSDDSFAPPRALADELVNNEKKHIAVFRIYYKVPVDVWIVADAETGDIYEGGKTEKEAKSKLKEVLEEKANVRVEKMQVVPQSDGETISFFVVDSEGNPMGDPNTGEPLAFPTEESAMQAIKDFKKNLMAEIGVNWKIWKRRRHLIKWAEFSANEILSQGQLSPTTQMYPYRVYISRQLGDEIEDIEGIVRQVIDRQKEITKRYNHLADHLAHSSHSGWLIRAGEPKLKRQLELLGARPGIVAEYASTPPAKIEPSNIPAGHFTLLGDNIGGIQRSTGINSELLGFTSTSTVSGEAITARQRGGATMLFGRLQNYNDFKRETANLILWLVQTTVPIEKMRRILGVWEAKNQTNILGTSVFLDPVTAMPVSEDDILSMLATVKSTRFDLTLKPKPLDQSVREQQFMKGLQMAQLVTTTGVPIGPMTLKMLGQMSDLPEMFLASIEADAQAQQQQMMAEQQMQQLGEAIKNQQARRGPNG